MDKASRKITRKVTTVQQAIAAFGGETKFMRAFQLDSLDTRHRSGVPPGHHLGLYCGLERRGYQVSPKIVWIDKLAPVARSVTDEDE